MVDTLWKRERSSISSSDYFIAVELAAAGLLFQEWREFGNSSVGRKRLKFAKGLIGPGAGTTVLIPLKSFWNYAPYRKELCIVISPLNKDSLYSIRNHKESASCYNLLEQL